MQQKQPTNINGKKCERASEKRMDAQQIICAVLKSHFTTRQLLYAL